MGQWNHKNKDIITAAKKMASLMDHLSQLVSGDEDSKSDLITYAREIAEASEEVTRLAKELARECPDKRMRTVSRFEKINRLLHKGNKSHLFTNLKNVKQVSV